MIIKRKSLAFVVGLSLASFHTPAFASANDSNSNSDDPEPLIATDMPSEAFTGSRSKQMLAVQIMLDRAGHSPGVIDGYGGGNTSRALESFERAAGLDVDGKVDAKVTAKLREAMGSEGLARIYTITDSDVAGPFEPEPSGMQEMAERDRIGYTSVLEMLAEKFHMDEGLLRALNPGADFATSGTEIRVAATQPGTIAGKVARIEIDKSNDELRAYDGDGNILATYPATVGSSQFPSPSGTMKVAAIAMEANYTFDPEDQDWGGDEALTIPTGPNNPIGGIWIDLGKGGYGIHGTTDPASIGKTASHGCVRLTNWDAEALAKAVQPNTTEVVFN